MQGCKIATGQSVQISGCRFIGQTAEQSAGRWFCQKYRRLARESGVQQSARNMRKQGVPLDVALAVLGVRQ